MSIQVILQPAGNGVANEHYADTVENPVEIKEVISFLGQQANTLLPAHIKEMEAVGVWGVTPGKNDVNTNKWKRINPGDIAIFVRGGMIFSTAIVAAKFRHEALSEHLWKRDKEGNTWEYIYLFDKIATRSIPLTDFNAAVGYAPNYPVYGFSVLNPERSAKALAALDIIPSKEAIITSQGTVPNERKAIAPPSRKVPPPKRVTTEDYEKAMEEWDNKSLDSVVETKARVEQGWLRDVLMGGKETGRCCICGKELPIQFLVAAHIKKRSECTESEKRDVRVVAPMCKLGCDELFERRYVTVGSNSKIISLSGKVVTPDLEYLMNVVNGKSCSYWSESTKGYFAWHYDQAYKR
ncbi:HNH endonuclease [Thermodesulfobacteriota bacterium]